VFLTYSRCPEGLDDLYEFINSKRKVNRAIGAVELHEANPALIDDDNPTGELPHVHFSIEFVEKLNTTNERYFDYNGYHPKIEPLAKGWEAAVNYLREEFGDYALDLKYYGCTEEDAADKPVEESKGSSLDVYEAARQFSREEYDKACLKEGISYAWAEGIWKRTHNRVVDSFTIYDAPGYLHTELPENYCARLANLTVPDNVDRKPLVILGASGCGKSSWATNNVPLPTLLVRHLDHLFHFDATIHKSILFDECAFGHLPLTNQINLLDTELPQAVHVRYGVAIIPRFTPKIFIFTDTIKLTEDVQLKRRCQIINLYGDMEPYWWVDPRHERRF